jgi:hypothetical protein
MKTLKIILLFFVLLIGTTSIANITQQPSLYDQNDLTQNVFEQANTVNTEVEYNLSDKPKQLIDKYIQNFRDCEPLYMSQYIDWFGLKFEFNIGTKGFIDNKCVYNINAKLEGLGKDIREVYNIKVTDEQLSKIEPQIKCNFTKEQLNALVDYIITEEEKSNNSKPKKGNAEILTPTQKELLSHFMEDNVCTVINMDTLKNQILEIIQSPEL